MRGTAAAAPCRGFDAHRAKPRERLAQAAVTLGDKQGQTEDTAPRLPFGDDVVARARAKQRQRQRRVAVLEHDGNGGRRLVRFPGEADGDAAERGERQIQRHAHAAHRAAHHDALAMQIDDAQALVGRFVRGFETHGQGERVEPQWGPHRACAMGYPGAARPGSDPAGFHLTPRITRLPPGCCRPVAARMPERGRNQLKNPG